MINKRFFGLRTASHLKKMAQYLSSFGICLFNHDITFGEGRVALLTDNEAFFKFYYKNINKSVFFYYNDIILDLSLDPDLDKINKILMNYFGVFFDLSSNFILYTDTFILKSIIKNKLIRLKSNFIIKRVFFNKPIVNYTRTNFFKKGNTNYFIVTLN